MDAMKRIVLPFVLLLLLALMLPPLGCSPKSSASRQGDARIVRVRLLAGVDQANVTLDHPPAISTDAGKSRRKLGVDAGQTVVVALTPSGWTLNGTLAGTGTLEIFPSVDGSASINSLPYRGSFRFVPAGGGRFDVVNDVDVESYLQGVLAKELFADWHPEAYRAQAIIARTYALYEAGMSPESRHWNLHPDERSQVYGGIKAETEKANAAVAATRGVVVVWGPTNQEKIFKAYFSSCCGGVSASVGDAFKEPVTPPLDARYNGNTCSMSPRYNWGPVTLRKDELAKRFRAWGERAGHPLAKINGLANIEIATTNSFGRPRRFTITDNAGQQYVISSEETRWALNATPPGVRSAGGITAYSGFFKPVDLGDSIQLIEGHGFGHGVGACQWCMQGRAVAGEAFVDIVLKAYPQSKVVRAY